MPKEPPPKSQTQVSLWSEGPEAAPLVEPEKHDQLCVFCGGDLATICRDGWVDLQGNKMKFVANMRLVEALKRGFKVSGRVNSADGIPLYHAYTSSHAQ